MGAEGVSIISLGCLASVSNLSEVQGEINAIANRHRRVRREVPTIHSFISQEDEGRREKDLEMARKLITHMSSLEVSMLLELALWKDQMGREEDLDPRGAGEVSRQV